MRAPDWTPGPNEGGRAHEDADPSCPPGCICRRTRLSVRTPLDVLETTALNPRLCTSKPGECDCFAEEPAMVTITIPREEAENIAAAAGDFAYIPTRLGPMIDKQLEARK